MSTDYAEQYQTARGRIFDLLSDLEWHSWRELKRIGGVRYSARLLELKRLGYAVDSDSEAPDGRIYRLQSLAKGAPKGKRVKVFLEESDVIALLEKGTLTKRAQKTLTDALGSFQANRWKL